MSLCWWVGGWCGVQFWVKRKVHSQSSVGLFSAKSWRWLPLRAKPSSSSLGRQVNLAYHHTLGAHNPANKGEELMTMWEVVGRNIYQVLWETNYWRGNSGKLLAGGTGIGERSRVWFICDQKKPDQCYPTELEHKPLCNFFLGATLKW